MNDFAQLKDLVLADLDLQLSDRFKFKFISVASVEVTQAIQYNRAARHLTDPADRGADNSVPLVQGKAAWVRVYVSSLFTSGVALRGQLRVERAMGWRGFYLPALTLSPQAPGVAVTAQDSYDSERGTLGTSLNFILPSDQMYGRMRLTAEIWADGAGPSAIADSRVVNIFPDLIQTLPLRGVMIHYNGPNAAGTRRFRPESCRSLRRPVSANETMARGPVAKLSAFPRHWPQPGPAPAAVLPFFCFTQG